MIFRHKTPIQLRFKDIDALGHVNNANHVTYLETARVAYFDEVIDKKIDWEAEGLILARIEVDYKQPILFHDKVVVYTCCSRIGTKSFELTHRIVNEKDGSETELALGKSVMVVFNYKERKSVPVPAGWVEKIRQFEQI